MTEPLRLAIFDVDGTLIDSQHVIVSAMTEAWRIHNLGIPDVGAVRRIIGLSLGEAVGTLAPHLSEDECRIVAKTYKDAFTVLAQQPDHEEPLFPGAREALQSLLDAGWLLGLATGKSRRGVWRMFDEHGLDGHFVTVQTADDNPGKPHPAMVVRAMAETGVEACDTIMVGDTTYDIQMARNASVTSLGVAWGNHRPDELIRCGAWGILDNYEDLAERLDSVLSCTSQLTAQAV